MVTDRQTGKTRKSEDKSSQTDRQGKLEKSEDKL